MSAESNYLNETRAYSPGSNVTNAMPGPAPEKEKTYPTAQDADGWFYEDEAQELMQVETRVDADENTFKRVAMSKGRTAIVRELTGGEMKMAQTMIGKDHKGQPNVANLPDAYAFLATKVVNRDGSECKFVMEDLTAGQIFKGKDYNRLTTAASMLNF